MLVATTTLIGCLATIAIRSTTVHLQPAAPSRIAQAEQPGHRSERLDRGEVIKEITIDYIPGFVRSPVFLTYKLNQDGSVVWTEKSWRLRQESGRADGEWHGRIEPKQFQRLAEEIDRLRFFEMGDGHASLDVSLVEVSVLRGDMRKKVTETAGLQSADIRMRAVVELIENTVDLIDNWEKVKNPTVETGGSR